MRTPKNEDENPVWKIIKSFFPQIVYYVVGAIIAFVVLRTDVASLTSRVTALESKAADRDMVAFQIQGVKTELGGQIDGLKSDSETFRKQYAEDIKEIKNLLYKHMGY